MLVSIQPQNMMLEDPEPGREIIPQTTVQSQEEALQWTTALQ